MSKKEEVKINIPASILVAIAGASGFFLSLFLGSYFFSLSAGSWLEVPIVVSTLVCCIMGIVACVAGVVTYFDT